MAWLVIVDRLRSSGASSDSVRKPLYSIVTPLYGHYLNYTDNNMLQRDRTHMSQIRTSLMDGCHTYISNNKVHGHSCFSFINSMCVANLSPITWMYVIGSMVE